MNIKGRLIEAHVFKIEDDIMKFLLLKRGNRDIYPYMWQMVTGRIEEGEKAWQTALREIKEETGLEPLRYWVLPNVNSFYSPESDAVVLIPVFASEVSAEQSVKLSEEHIDYKWVEYEECLAAVVWPGHRRSVEILYEYYTNRRKDLDLAEIKL